MPKVLAVNLAEKRTESIHMLAFCSGVGFLALDVRCRL